MTGFRSVVASFLVLAVGGAETGHAFDHSKHSVPLDRIVSGGPSKDGIPALRSPTFVRADQAHFLKDDDRIVGLREGGHAKAYPVRILNWHEAVNDEIAGRPVLVTYCPLTASAVVFDRRGAAGEELTFGISGRLYESNVLFYDHQTESLWSQLMGESVVGERTRETLRPLPMVETTWRWWRRRHPDTLVLSTSTGYAREYEHDPYESYATSARTAFAVSHRDPRLPAKERVIGIVVGGAAKAYPITNIRRAPTPVRDRIGGRAISIHFDAESDTARAFDDERPLVSVVAYWFAWAAFHAHTALWDPGSGGQRSEYVEVSGTEGYWSSLTGVVTDSPEGRQVAASDIYVIKGRVSNVSDVPVHHVRLMFELLDEEGAVVHRQEGYNRDAESLQPAAFVREPEATVIPIPPGGQDDFRMLFFGDELPAFHDIRVRVAHVE